MKKINLPLTIIITLIVAVLGFSVYYFLIRGDSAPSVDTTPKNCTTYNDQVEEQCVEDYIGLTQEEAVARAKAHNYLPKIALIDSVSQVNTDEGGYRVYLEIENGVVVNAYFEDGRPRT